MSKHYHLDYGVRETRKWRRLLFIPVSLGLVIYGSFVILSKSAPQTTVDVSKAALSQTTQTPSSAAQPKITVPISWPKYGYAAYSVPKDNIVVASINKPQRVPIASLAKVITVLAVLKESPLEPGQQGPMITLDEQDVALVSEYAQKSGSTVPVIAGEQISQYQMMQAILMPSSNNMSDAGHSVRLMSTSFMPIPCSKI